MGSTCLAPGFGLGVEVMHASTERYIVAAEVFDRPAEAGDPLTQPFPGVDGVVGAASEEDEAVREPGGPVERCLAGSAKPYGDGSRRLGNECGSVDPVEAAGEVDDRLGEQPA